MRRLAAVALVLGLAACDGEDPVTSVTREVSAANHAAATVARIEAEAEANASAAPASSSDAAYVAMTLQSHREALERAETVLMTTQDSRVRALAQAEVQQRAAQIASLEGRIAKAD